MAKDRDIKLMIRKVNATMDKLEKFLNSVKIDGKGSIEVEKDRVAYKEGLVDGLCMTSWNKDSDITAVGADKIDYVGGGEGKVLKEVLEEIGSVYGFDGKEEYYRITAERASEIDAKEREAVESNKRLKDEIDPNAIETKVIDMKGKEVEVKE